MCLNRQRLHLGWREKLPQFEDSRKSQFIGIELNPSPDGRVLSSDAHVKEVLPTIASENVCLCIKFVGFEANPGSFRDLHKLCNPDEVDGTGNPHVLRLTELQ
jgi:hypothetical protein